VEEQGTRPSLTKNPSARYALIPVCIRFFPYPLAIRPRRTVSELQKRIRTCDEQIEGARTGQVRPYRCTGSLRSQRAPGVKTLRAISLDQTNHRRC
jgi:hypothetical protein